MHPKFLITLMALFVAVGCDRTGNNVVADGSEKSLPATTSPGKPTAPVHIEYSVLGNAIVGQPVAIELRLSSPFAERPMTMSYFINDADSMLLGESQPREINLSMEEDDGVATRQVTVVPQREGRLYLNVTVEMQTDAGAMLKSMAVPIAVGPGSEEAAVNGTLRAGPNGEMLVSMPAREN